MIYNYKYEYKSVSQNFFMGDYKNYKIACELYGQPFSWLLKVLKNMTRFEYPSGYALINPRLKIITNIWAGPTDEYALGRKKIDNIDCCIYIDNFEGPEHGISGWKGISSKEIIEKTFGIELKEENLKYFGGFPNDLVMSY